MGSWLPITPPLIANYIRFHCIISPDGWLYSTWDTLMCLMVLYTLVVPPFQLGFLEESDGASYTALYIMDWVIIGFFAVDFFGMFLLGLYVAPPPADDGPNTIAEKFLMRTFIYNAINVISTLLCHQHISKFKSIPLMTFIWFLPRLFCLRRVRSLCARVESYVHVRVLIYLWILELTCVALIVVHCFGCFFYLLTHGHHSKTWIGGPDFDFRNEPLWTRYVVSVYWSATTFSTTGYGDFHPQNTAEMIFGLVYMLVAAGFMTYLTGNLGNLIVYGTSRIQQFREMMWAARNFVRKNKLPYKLEGKILSYLVSKWENDLENMTLNLMPESILSGISRSLFNSLSKEIYLFNGISSVLRSELAEKMKLEYFSPEELIISRDRTKNKLYISMHGPLDVFVNDRDVLNVKSVHICGEIGMFCNIPQPFNARPQKGNQFLTLDLTTFQRVTRGYTGDLKCIMKNLHEHMEKAKQHDVTADILREIQNMVESEDFSRGRESMLSKYLLEKKREDSNQGEGGPPGSI